MRLDHPLHPPVAFAALAAALRGFFILVRPGGEALRRAAAVAEAELDRERQAARQRAEEQEVCAGVS